MNEHMLLQNCGERSEQLHRLLQKQARNDNLTFADEIDKKWPQTQYLCWIAALSFCHFFIVFFLLFCFCQNFFYFSQGTDAFSKINICNQSDIF